MSVSWQPVCAAAGASPQRKDAATAVINVNSTLRENRRHPDVRRRRTSGANLRCAPVSLQFLRGGVERVCYQTLLSPLILIGATSAHTPLGSDLFTTSLLSFLAVYSSMFILKSIQTVRLNYTMLVITNQKMFVILNETRNWWSRRDLNPRPHEWNSCALPY